DQRKVLIGALAAIALVVFVRTPDKERFFQIGMAGLFCLTIFLFFAAFLAKVIPIWWDKKRF
ncbi:MAG: hypothetical protein M9947_06020, partial [Thermomicrobiales bacterium]|nr:hypothetical protein [Thermomicrobiales bacterium]